MSLVSTNLYVALNPVFDLGYQIIIIIHSDILAIQLIMSSRGVALFCLDAIMHCDLNNRVVIFNIVVQLRFRPCETGWAKNSHCGIQCRSGVERIDTVILGNHTHPLISFLIIIRVMKLQRNCPQTLLNFFSLSIRWQRHFRTGR